MRRLAICMALTAWLVPAGVAAAKEPVAAKVCGASDCRTVKDREALMAFTEGGPPTDPPDRGAPWYSVRMTVEIDHGRHDQFRFVIVPELGLMRAGDASGGYSWMPVSPTAARVYRRVTADVVPFPAAKLRAVGPTEQVELPAADPKSDGGSSSPLPWVAGGVVVLLGLVLALIRWRGRPWPRAAQG